MITIVEHILSASHDSSQTGILKLGDVQLSMPPANVGKHFFQLAFYFLIEKGGLLQLQFGGGGRLNIYLWAE